MKLRRDSLIVRLYFWSLRFDGLHYRILNEPEAGSDLCAVVRRVFLILPVGLALFTSLAVVGLFGIGFLHWAAGWVVCLGVYGALAIVTIGIVGGRLIARHLPQKERYCPRVEFID